MSPASLLVPWASFYTITGSAAAALTGLMFVVITLVTQTRRSMRSSEGTAAFNTPSVFHFAVALLVSAILSAPWRSLIHVAVLLGLAGGYGIVYVLRIAYRIRRMDAYEADLEDWCWHTWLPLLAYVGMLAAAFALPVRAVPALFVFASAIVVLLACGIHNAWDVVTFVTLADRDAASEAPKVPGPTETRQAGDDHDR